MIILEMASAMNEAPGDGGEVYPHAHENWWSENLHPIVSPQTLFFWLRIRVLSLICCFNIFLNVVKRNWMAPEQFVTAFHIDILNTTLMLKSTAWTGDVTAPLAHGDTRTIGVYQHNYFSAFRPASIVIASEQRRWTWKGSKCSNLSVIVYKKAESSRIWARQFPHFSVQYFNSNSVANPWKTFISLEYIFCGSHCPDFGRP